MDTHSDLAFGPPGPDFVLKAVLTRAPQTRAAIANYRAGIKLDEANYLLFALAFRWVSRLTYVRNPRSRQDVPQRLLAGPGAIRLTSDIARLMEGVNGPEPEIPFAAVDDYRALHPRDERLNALSCIFPKRSGRDFALPVLLLPVFAYISIVSKIVTAGGVSKTAALVL